MLVSQEQAVFGVMAILGLYWLQRGTRRLWIRPVSGWLLKRGKVRLAMRLRFGKRCH